MLTIQNAELSLLSENRMTLYSMNLLEDGQFFSTELATAVIPFTFSGRIQYKAVLRLMAIFHVSILAKDYV